MNPHGRAIIFGFLISTASLAAIAGSVLADADSEFNERGNYIRCRDDQFYPCQRRDENHTRLHI
jgi:hypothetical protein